jgi:hypothetical protein
LSVSAVPAAHAPHVVAPEAAKKPGLHGSQGVAGLESESAAPAWQLSHAVAVA